MAPRTAVLSILATGGVVTAMTTPLPVAAHPGFGTTPGVQRTDVVAVPVAVRRVNGRTLVIKVTGLPGDLKGRVNVTGPDDYRKDLQIAAKKKLKHLAIGRYRVSAQLVARGDRTWRAAVSPKKPVRVTARRGRTVLVHYVLRQQPPSVKPLQAQQLAAGSTHTCALDTAGRAWCWGEDVYQELGDGREPFGADLPEPAPVAVRGGHRFTTIDAGSAHTCALDRGGQAWCWGFDMYGQVGDGGTRTARAVPTAVKSARRFVAISAGGMHTCGLASDRTAWCWGSDSGGELGNGAPRVAAQVPVRVAGGLRFKAIAAGSGHTCGVATDGRAWCWGNDDFGALGDSPKESGIQPKPVAVVGGHRFGTVTSGGVHSCGLTAAGDAWCWGYDDTGAIGDGEDNTWLKATPVRVLSDVVGEPFRLLASDRSNTCALDDTGLAWCWGSDEAGTIGDGDDAVVDWTLVHDHLPKAVAGSRRYSAIAVGLVHACAVAATGTAWCWGGDSTGQLGNGAANRGTAWVPEQVAGGHRFLRP